MTRVEKATLIDELTESFKSSNAIAVCDYKGLTVAQLESLRKDVRGRGGKVQVVKNTLASIALKNAEKDGLELDGTNIFVGGDFTTIGGNSYRHVAKLDQTNGSVDNTWNLSRSGQNKCDSSECNSYCHYQPH